MARILVFGPHPDDQELGMGGTIARLAEQGHDVVLVDMTDGEPTPHGHPATRATEARQAPAILGVRRRPSGPPDGQPRIVKSPPSMITGRPSMRPYPRSVELGR